MAVVTLQDYTRQSTNGTASSITLTKPLSVVDGDMLILLVGNENSTNDEGFDLLAGWTRHFNYGSGAEDCYIAMFYRTADGTEGATETVQMLGNDDAFGWYIRVDGHWPSNPMGGLIGHNGVVNTITGHNMTITADALVFSALAFDGSDADPFVVDPAEYTLIDWLESPDPSDAGGAASGAFATTASQSITPIWTWNGTTDGVVHVQFTVNPVPKFEGSAAIVSGSNVSLNGTLILKSSATIVSGSNLTVAGEYFGPTIGKALIVSASNATSAQTIIFPMWSPLFGEALLTANSTVTCDALVSGEQRGEINIVNNSTITCDGYDVLVRGASNIVNSSIITCDGFDVLVRGAATLNTIGLITVAGILTGPSAGFIFDRLEAKVTELEQRLNDVPEGTDFLKAEDIRSFFTASERGVLYGV